MAGLSVCGTFLRIMLFITVCLMISTTFRYPFPTGLNAMGLDDMHDDETDLMMRNALFDVEESSWTKPSSKAPKNLAFVDGKILKFVARIIELDKSLVSAQRGTLSNTQECDLKQMMTQLNLVKTLFERSVYLMKLADIASHGMDSSPWIDWDQLESAAKELEENMKTLHLRDEKDRPIYICFTRESVIALSLVLMTISCLLLAQKVVRWVRRR